MTHTSRVTANRLGALSLALADRVQESAAVVAGHGASGPAALTALAGDAGGATIDTLRGRLGLTHSGTVRLVDRLAADGLVERRVGPDARAVALHLTPQGRRSARRVATAREAALEQALSVLPPGRREQLDSLLTALLAGLAEDAADPRAVCRLCDHEACGGACPMRQPKPST